MKICAIVLNYRNATCTESSLLSLSGQGLDALLVVDNSDDDSYSSELAVMMERQADFLDYTLHLLKPDGNLGFSRGVNLALSHEAALRCDAILLINNDAVAQPGMVARLASALADADCELAAPTIVDAAGKPQPVLWYQRFFGLLTTRRLPGSFQYLSGCCLMFGRNMLLGGKLFDEEFFMYGEDTQLGWRLKQTDSKVCHLDDAFVRHLGVGSSRQYGIFYEYHTARAHVLLAWKTWHYRIEIPLLLITKTTGLALRAALRSLRSGSMIPLRAFALAWLKQEIHSP